MRKLLLPCLHPSVKRVGPASSNTPPGGVSRRAVNTVSTWVISITRTLIYLVIRGTCHHTPSIPLNGVDDGERVASVERKERELLRQASSTARIYYLATPRDLIPCVVISFVRPICIVLTRGIHIY